jgi:hypothetical protein
MSGRRQQTAFHRAAGIPVAACGEGVEAERTGWMQDAPGVRRRARGDSLAWNRRDPTRRPASGEGGAYKPTAKGYRAGRESEEPIVPLKVAYQNATRGKGLCFGVSAMGVSARA